MGVYINGIGESKQEKIDWLQQHAWLKRVSNGADEVKFDFDHHASKNRRIICAVDSGDFIAVAVAYDKQELERFMIPDGRSKAWFTMNVDEIIKVCPEAKGYLDE